MRVSDLLYTWVLLGVTGTVSLVYAIRVIFMGRARDERIERQGGSVFLHKTLLEMGYWGMRPFAHTLIRLGVTPNGLTWANLIFGAVNGVCLAFGLFGTGAAFAALSGVLDGLDGMVARLSARASDEGKVLDTAIDRYSEFFFLAGLSVYYRESPAMHGLILGALLASFMVSYSTAVAAMFDIELGAGVMRRPERVVYLTAGAALTAPVRLWFGTDLPMAAALVLVAVIGNCSAIARYKAIRRALRKTNPKQAAAA